MSGADVGFAAPTRRCSGAIARRCQLSCRSVVGGDAELCCCTIDAEISLFCHVWSGETLAVQCTVLRQAVTVQFFPLSSHATLP
eukprot:1219946-Rhodomonas_salina.1